MHVMYMGGVQIVLIVKPTSLTAMMKSWLGNSSNTTASHVVYWVTQLVKYPV